MIEESKRALELSFILERAGQKICAAGGVATLAYHERRAVDKNFLSSAEGAAYDVLEAIKTYRLGVATPTIRVAL